MGSDFERFVHVVPAAVHGTDDPDHPGECEEELDESEAGSGLVACGDGVGVGDSGVVGGAVDGGAAPVGAEACGSYLSAVFRHCAPAFAP